MTGRPIPVLLFFQFSNYAIELSLMNSTKVLKVEFHNAFTTLSLMLQFENCNDFALYVTQLRHRLKIIQIINLQHKVQTEQRS